MCRFSTSLLELPSMSMVLDSALSSPHRRSQNSAFSSPTYKKQLQLQTHDLGSWSTLFLRHRFLLTALVLLAFLCTIYLYFAITLGKTGVCAGLTGKENDLCRLEQAKTSVSNGKLKFF